MTEEQKCEQVVEAVSVAAEAGVATSLGLILGLSIWSVIVAALSGFIVWHFAEQQWQRDLVMRPPVVVIDTFGWIKSAGVGATVQEQYSDGATRLNQAVAQLRAKGALVLDASAVRASPDVVRLDTPSREPKK